MTIMCDFFFFSSRRRHTRLQGDWSSDVCSSDLLIEAARLRVAANVNSELTLLYWHIGQHIHGHESEVRQAGCSDEVLPVLAGHLVQDYGSSFSEKNLWRMTQFSTAFPDQPLVISPTRKLSWAHFIVLIAIKDPVQREYYASMASL